MASLCTKCGHQLRDASTPDSTTWTCDNCGWEKEERIVTKCCGSTWKTLAAAGLPLMTCDDCGHVTEGRLETWRQDPTRPERVFDVSTTFRPNLVKLNG